MSELKRQWLKFLDQFKQTMHWFRQVGLPIHQSNASALVQDPKHVSMVHPKASITGFRHPCALWKCNECTNLCTYCMYLCICDQIGPAVGVKVRGKTLIQ